MAKKETTSKKQDEQASFFHELGSFMQPYMGKYVASVVVSLLSVGAKLAAYAFAGIIAAELFSGTSSTQRILTLAAIVILCKLLDAALLNVATWISHSAAYPTLKDIRDAVSSKLLRLPLGYFEENGTGRLKTMLVDRIEGMEKTLAHMIPELTANLLAPLALVVWMFFIDWRLALCALIWVVAGFSVTFGMMKGYEEKYAGQIAAEKTMNQAVTEYVGGIEVIKNFGRADECYQKYQDAVYGHASYNVNWMKETQIYSALGMAIAPFSLFPVLIAGLFFYSRNTLEPSTLVLMILLTLGVFGPLMQSMNYFDQVAQMGTHAKEIKTILEWPELERKGSKSTDRSDVEFSHVSFSYTAADELALQDISFLVPQGTMLALVGPSGSGKSTIAKLLAGYWDVGSGEIRIGGTPLSQLSHEELNQKIAYVDQETFLFDTTILENIRLGNPAASDQMVMDAAKHAGCDEFIRALPQGYNTPAGLAGGRLSGGERQRIAIARAMLKQAPIMILDEATASSDPENEASIQAALSAAAKGKTLIVVAHHLATIVDAQQIAFVQDGRIQAIGTHEQLMGNCPQYAALWALSEEG